MAAPETPKGASSRLLSMKFMQRAVASAASTPESEAPSSKKRKTFHSPAQAQIDASINQASVQRAIEERDAKRRDALRQHSSKDTQWVLTNAMQSKPKAASERPRLNVVYVGYGDYDSDEADSPAIGRMSTMAPKAQEKDESEEDSSEDADNNRNATGPDSADPKSSEKRHRSTPDSKEAARAKEFRDKRRKKEVNMGAVTSISSGGGISGGGYTGGSSKLCHRCQKPGHMMANCPNNPKRGHKKS